MAFRNKIFKEGFQMRNNESNKNMIFDCAKVLNGGPLEKQPVLKGTFSK